MLPVSPTLTPQGCTCTEPFSCQRRAPQIMAPPARFIRRARRIGKQQTMSDQHTTPSEIPTDDELQFRMDELAHFVIEWEPRPRGFKAADKPSTHETGDENHTARRRNPSIPIIPWLQAAIHTELSPDSLPNPRTTSALTTASPAQESDNYICKTTHNI
jgi:hypothetical protein